MTEQALTLDNELSPNLCEFIGALIGDGFIGTHTGQVQLTGDATLDREYYLNYIIPLCNDLFSYTPRIYIQKNTMRARIYSTALKRYLSTYLQFPIGEKSHTITIPELIMNGPDECRKAVLRGMFDTDGGLFFDQRPTYDKPYVRIGYTSVSRRLISQASDLLSAYEIPHGVSHRRDRGSWRIQINGEENVKRFVRTIGFSNPRHKKKVSYLL